MNIYFKIFPHRDVLNKDPKEAKKIKGFIVECGYGCRRAYMCPHSHKCKYRPRYKWHNFSVNVSRFLLYRFHINFNFPIYFQKHGTDLSGTTMCPHNVPRLYTCWDCIYSCGDRECSNKKRLEMIDAGRWKELDDPNNTRICKLFEANKYADKYDRKTGEHIF